MLAQPRIVTITGRDQESKDFRAISTGPGHHLVNQPPILRVADDSPDKLVNLMKKDLVFYDHASELPVGVLPSSGQTIQVKRDDAKSTSALGLIMNARNYFGLVLPPDFDPEHTLYVVSDHKLHLLKGYVLQHQVPIGHFAVPAYPVRDAANKILGPSGWDQGLGDPLDIRLTTTPA